LPEHENDAIMSAIHDANATAGTSEAPQFDFPAALSNYQTQDGNVPLTPQERNQVLSRMINNTSAANTNNALTNPNPAEISSLVNDMNQYQATQQQLELLQKISDEQASRVQSLQERLQPLSPSGQIPGLTDNEYFGSTASLGDPGQYDLDLDSFVQDHDYFPDNSAAGANGNTGGLPDFNFDTATPDLNGASGFDSTGAGFNFDTDPLETKAGHLNINADSGHADGKAESISSNAASPATVEEVEDETRVGQGKSKRRKT